MNPSLSQKEKEDGQDVAAASKDAAITSKDVVVASKDVPEIDVEC